MTTYRIEFSEDYVKPLLPGRDQWIAALRSDAFKQGQDSLMAKGRHCCLGVLCVLQDRPKETRGLATYFDGDCDILGADNPAFGCLSSCGLFPGGLDFFIRVDNGPEECVTNLAACNDGGLTFPQIADVISQIWTDAPHNWSTMRNPIPCTPSQST